MVIYPKNYLVCRIRNLVAYPPVREVGKLAYTRRFAHSTGHKYNYNHNNEVENCQVLVDRKFIYSSMLIFYYLHYICKHHCVTDPLPMSK